MTMDKERLAAFADGELSPEDAAAVVMYLADHPEDQAWVDDLMAANAALARAYSAPMQEPVPERFRNLILPEESGAKVLPFRRRVLPMFAGLGMAAAALAAVVVLFPQDQPRLVAGPVEQGSALDTLLTEQPSGAPAVFGPGEITILASLPAAEGFCREMELVEAEVLNLALACRQGGHWTVDIVMAESIDLAPEGQGFAPASGQVATTLEPWLNARGTGMTLSPGEEAAAIANSWRK